MKREEPRQELHFVIVNDGAHDFDLTQEALIGDRMVAVIYRVGWGSAEEWHVSFFPSKNPRDTQRVSEEREKALKNWQRRQKCVFLRENE